MKMSTNKSTNEERCPECGSKVKNQSSRNQYYVYCTKHECDWFDYADLDYEESESYKMSRYDY